MNTNRLVPSHQIRQGDSALTAPRTPEKRVPNVDKSKVDPELLKAAHGMEAMFLDHMMQVMRQTVPKSDMSLDNMATGIYQGMMDSEMAQTAARQGGIGLSDLIVAYMNRDSYNGQKEQAAPTQVGDLNRPSTGGTNEGQSIAD